MADSKKDTLWHVSLSTKADKQANKMPKKVLDQLTKLLKSMEISGPIQKDWPHFSSLEKSKKLVPKDSYHCHIKRGRPTYVACWQEVDKKKKSIEVFYVGTHEGSPY
jgi:hypothetical protein